MAKTKTAVKKTAPEKKVSKMELVKQHLLKYKSITSWQAINLYQYTRLASSICNLKKKGWEITTQSLNFEGGVYAKYILVSAPSAKK